MSNIPEQLAEKLPTVDQYSKNPGTVTRYIFMLIFVGYFFYSEFLKKDDCGSKIEAFEKVILQKDDMIQKLNARVTKLETALDVKTGVIERVEQQVAAVPAKTGGVQ